MNNNQNTFNYNSQLNHQNSLPLNNLNNLKNPTQKPLNVISNMQENENLSYKQSTNNLSNFNSLQTVSIPEEDIPTINPQLNILQQELNNPNELNRHQEPQLNVIPHENINLNSPIYSQQREQNNSNINSQFNIIQESTPIQTSFNQNINTGDLNIPNNNQVQNNIDSFISSQPVSIPEEDIPTINPQLNILQQELNNPNELNRHQEPQLNVIPHENINLNSPISGQQQEQNNSNMKPQNEPNLNIINNGQTMTSNTYFNIPQLDQQFMGTNQITVSEDDKIKIETNNRFINNNFNTNTTTLNDLNIENDDKNVPRIDYSKDPKVKKNMENDAKLKKTITITEEVKVFLIIIAILLIFIFVMPYIFDSIRDIKY